MSLHHQVSPQDETASAVLAVGKLGQRAKRAPGSHQSSSLMEALLGAAWLRLTGAAGVGL